MSLPRTTSGLLAVNKPPASSTIASAKMVASSWHLCVISLAGLILSCGNVADIYMPSSFYVCRYASSKFSYRML